MQENQGYKIIKNVRLNDDLELVVGYNEKQMEPYVCWYHRDDNDYYFWGRYTTTYEEANYCLNQRVCDNESEIPLDRCDAVIKEAHHCIEQYEQEKVPSINEAKFLQESTMTFTEQQTTWLEELGMSL